MNTANEKSTQDKVTEKKKGRKASTAELPMVDLATVLNFAKKIEAEGLQTLPQQEVAKRLGYAAQTSTPFYRRVVAARLFGLLDTTQGVNLTKLALDYIKPTDEPTGKTTLFTAMKNVIAYQGILERYSGKRLPPVDILRNSFERDFRLEVEAAMACAEVFERSAKFAGLVSSDGALRMAISERLQSASSPENPTVQPATFGSSPHSPLTPAESESHYLTLDAKRGRRVIVQAPPVITVVELKRIQAWLAVQLHVVDSEPAQAKNPPSDEADNSEEAPAN